MRASDEFRKLDMSFVAEPPLRDARRPLSMAFRQMHDLSFVAFAGLEIERIVIRSASASKGDDERLGMWKVAVDALTQLASSREFWYVITTRRPAGPDGSTLRTGWLAVGRGVDSFEAAQNCEDTLDDLRTIYGGSIAFAASAPVTDESALLDLVRPAGAPFVRSFRRQRWKPAIYVGERVQSPVTSPEPNGVVLPWSGGAANWGPLAEALANSPSHAAFVVRVSAGNSVPPEALASAERELRQIGVFYEELLGVRSRDLTMVPESFERLMRLAGERLLTLQGRCLCVDVNLVAWEPLNSGLLSLAAAVITSRPPGEAAGSPQVRQQDPMPLEPIALDAGVLLEPLDPATSPDHLVGPREAVTLVRTIEPPEDERSPLACSRSRILSLRNAPLDGTHLGTSEERGLTRDVHLGERARFQHVYVVGQTGTGKSTLMLALALGDIRAGHGVTILDPHGSLVEAILERMPRERIDDVVVMDSTDSQRIVGLNPLDFQTADPWEYLSRRDQTIEELFDTFDALYDMRQAGGPVFEQYFRIFMGLLCGTRRPTEYTPILPMLTVLMQNPRLARILALRLGDEDPITSGLLKEVTEASGEMSLSNVIPYVSSKLNRFYSSAQARRILCQERSLDFGSIIRDRRILLVELPKGQIGPETSALIARQIVAGLATAVFRAGAGAGPAHFVYADEFHTFATERFALLMSEARKFRLGLVLAHQYTSQLNRRGEQTVLDAVLGNVGTVIAFRVGVQDAKLLGGVMAPRVAPEDIAGLPNFSACVRSVGELGNVPFVLRTKPPTAPAASSVEEIRARSRERYGVPPTAIDASIASNLEALKGLAAE